MKQFKGVAGISSHEYLESVAAQQRLVQFAHSRIIIDAEQSRTLDWGRDRHFRLASPEGADEELHCGSCTVVTKRKHL